MRNDWRAQNLMPASMQHLGHPPIFIFDEERDAVPQNHLRGDDAGAGAQRVSTELRHGQ